jgi:hypothetical protein
MKKTTVINWESKTGKVVRVEIEMGKSVVDKIADLDGQLINLGKKTEDFLCIMFYADDKLITRDYSYPSVVTKASYGDKHYNDLVSKGVYARLGDAYISEELYSIVITTLDNLYAEFDVDAEYEQVKNTEIKKELAEQSADLKAFGEYEQQVKQGLCIKCGTYCYGDCTANEEVR